MRLNSIITKAIDKQHSYVFAHETAQGRKFESSNVVLCSKTDTHTYEVLCFNVGVYFYIDIDTHVVLQDVLQYLTNICFQFFKVNITIQVASACTSNKTSYHIVTSLPLRSIKDASQFAQRIHIDNPSVPIDMNVYKTHQNWRMLYQSKLSQTDRPFLPVGSSIHPKDHMIGIYTNIITFECSFTVPRQCTTTTGASGIDITHYLDKSLTPRPNSLASESIEYLMSCIPNTDKGQPWITWLYLGFALKNAGAGISTWIQWSNTWSGDDQTKTCERMWNTFEKKDDGFNIGTIIRCATSYVVNPFGDFIKAEITDIHEIQGVFTYNNPYVLPYVFPDNTRCILERSHMGTGKTFQLFQYIDTHAPLRIIHLAARQDYATSIHGEYTSRNIHMDNYLSITNPESSDRIIIQMESLWKLVGDNTFDLVILDEIESLLKQWSSLKTMKNRIKSNAHVFEILLKNASRIIGLDAFLSNKSLQCLSDMNIHPYVRHNTFQPYKRTAINCGSKQALVSTLIKELSLGRKCVLFTASQRFGLDIQLTIKTQMAYKTTRFYHSGCNDATRTELHDVHLHWKLLDLLIYTPCITVGINYALDTFDTLFLYGSCMSSNVRDCFQSSLRVRHIKTNICYFALHTKLNQQYIPTSTADIKKSIASNTLIFDYDELHKCPDWLLHIHISNIREDNLHKKYYKHVFHMFLDWCGYSVVDFQSSQNYAIHQATDTHYHDISDVDNDEFDILSQQISNRTATSDVKMTYSKHLFDQYIVNPDASLLYRAFMFDAFYTKKNKQHIIRNLRDEIHSSPETVADVELSNASYIELAATGARSPAFHSLTRVLHTLDLPHTHYTLHVSDTTDKSKATRTINEWSGSSLVKCKNGLRIKKSHNIVSCI